MLWESRCVLTGVRGQRPGHSLCWFTREGGLWVLHSVVRSVPWACLGPACTPHWAGSGPRHREHSDCQALHCRTGEESPGASSGSCAGVQGSGGCTAVTQADAAPGAGALPGPWCWPVEQWVAWLGLLPCLRACEPRPGDHCVTAGRLLLKLLLCPKGWGACLPPDPSRSGPGACGPSGPRRPPSFG